MSQPFARDIEASYRRLLDRNLAGIYRSTVSGRILECNQAFATIYGYASPEEVCVASAQSFYTDPSKRLAFIALLRQHGSLSNYEGCGRRKDGVVIWTLENCTLLPGENGEEIIEGTIIDITDRKQAEERLRASEQHLRRVLDELGPHMFVGLLTPDGKVLEANRNALEAAGLRSDQVLGKPVEETYWWSYSEPVQQRLRAAVQRAAAGETVRYDADIRVAAGRFITLDFCIHPLLGGDGRVEYLVPSGVVITERKRAEEALREREALLRSIVENDPNCVKVLDAAGCILQMNPSGLGLLEADSFDQVEGRSVYDLVVPGDRERVRESLAAALQGTPVAFDAEIRTLKGTPRWMEAQAAPLRDAAGRVVHILCITRDVTERKHAEEALRASEERFHRAFHAAPNALCIARLDDGCFLEVNQAFERMTGYSRSEVLGRTSLELGITVEPHQRAAMVEALRRQGSVRDLDFYFRTKAGEVRCGQLGAELIRIGDQDCYILMARDLTEQKQAQEALLKSEDRYRDLVQHSEDLICTHALDGQILSANPAAVRMLGYEMAELLRMNIRDILAPEVQPAFDQYIDRLKREGSARGRMVVQTRSGGKRIWEYANTLRTEGLANPIVRGMAHDVTEREHAQQALRESEARLRLSAESANVGLWDWDLLTNQVVYSPQWKSQIGYGEDEISDSFQEWETRVHPDDLEPTLQKVRAFLANPQGKYEVEFRFRHKDGSYRWIYAQGDVLRDTRGKPVRMLGCHIDITERKRADEALRLSEERFHRAFHSSPDAISIATLAEGRYIEVNDSFLQASGYQRSEVIGRTGVDLGLWDDPKERDRLLRKLMQGQPLRNEEFTFSMRNSERRVALVSGDVIDVYGEKCLLTIARDITDRKRAERALRESEDRLRNLFEQASDGIFLITSDNRYLDANASGLEMLGYTRDELLRMSVADVLVPHEVPRLEVEPRRMMAGEPHLAEWIHRRKDGSTFPGEVSARRLDEHTYMAIVRDLTARKRAEEALRVSESRYRHLLESNIVGVLISDVSGNILEANEAYLAMTGFTREDLRNGLRWTEITSPEYRQADEEAVRELLASGASRLREKEYVRKDGSRIPVVVGAALLDKSLGTMVAFVLDLTEQKRLENDLNQVRKMEAIGQLAGGVAHDFNNLLMVIQSYADLIAMQACDEKTSRYASQVSEAAKRAAGVTQQLLAFSRKQVLKREVVDLNLLIQGTLKMLGRLIGEDIEVALHLSPQDALVLADRGQLEQVLINLAVNARDAMPKGGRLLIETGYAEFDQDYCRRHPGAAPGRFVLLAVTDTGMGMDAATQARVFEPFFTTKGLGKGTGLGLATVYGIVKQSDGFIWVYSEPGEGSCFKVYLPCVHEVAEAAPPPIQEEAPGGRETVLVVEDEESLRVMICEFLTAKGYTVLQAGGGVDAVALAGQHPGRVDALLCDVIMPGAHGPDVVPEILGFCPDASIIYMSGYTDRALDLENGASRAAFLQKPFTMDALARTLRQALETSRKPAPSFANGGALPGRESAKQPA